MTAVNQVQLSKLLFGHSWEDPESDRAALRIRRGDTLLTITSGGCNTLTLLLEGPARVHAVDINPAQSHLLELKIAVMRRFELVDFRKFIGVDPTTERWAMFESVADDLSPSAAAYWRAHREIIEGGVVEGGRYERFLALFRKGLRLVHGRRHVRQLFECRSLDDQREFYDRVWDSVRWRALFRLTFNKWILARRGLSADYFRFDDGSTSFAQSFYRRARRALRELPIGENYFLSHYLLGRYTGESNTPAYLQPASYATIRQRLDRIRISTADATQWLSERDTESIGCFSLSNIGEVMSVEGTEKLFREVTRTACHGARVCFRNLIVPRSIPDSLREKIQRDDSLSEHLLATDRSIVYSRVDAYQVVQ